jgi:hypothetical protein
LDGAVAVANGEIEIAVAIEVCDGQSGRRRTNWIKDGWIESTIRLSQRDRDRVVALGHRNQIEDAVAVEISRSHRKWARPDRKVKSAEDVGLSLGCYGR